jgi:hypothetical protein
LRGNFTATLLLLAAFGVQHTIAQNAPPANSIDRDRALRVEFEAALAGNPDLARKYLHSVIDRPWLGEMNFHESCALARAIEDTEDASLAEKLVLAAGLHNPALALREADEYLSRTNGQRLFEQFVMAAPDDAVAIASGTTKSAYAFRDLIAHAGSPETALLARISAEDSIDLPRRGRLAILARRITSGALSFDSALKIAGSEPQFFAAALDMRAAATGAEAKALDRVLENQSLVLCRAAQENLQRIVGNDLAQFRARDLYALLSLGRAEATPVVFSAVFDRLLQPKLKAESPKARSLVDLLDRTGNWGLRDFAAGAIAARRFEALLAMAGRELVSRLAHGLDQSPDPLKEGMRLAEIVDATHDPVLLEQMASIVSAEFARCRAAADLRGTTVYGLLAAKLSVSPIAGPYLPFFRSSETLDTALLFGDEKHCVQRHFFYDDDDGVESFASFRKTYEHDPAWQLEDLGEYVRVTGHGPQGRTIEIYANVPIDTHLPKNRLLEGEAQRRQATIAKELNQRRLTPTVIVHRGHSFWTERTLSYLEKSARLVILGSCGGAGEVHAVIEASHNAQVIATRGIGTTEINDSILKAVNDRLLNGEQMIGWSIFWKELKERWGNSAIFRDYLAPNQDSATVFLRSYYRFLDALN